MTKTCLVVDDSRATRAVLRRMLNTVGFDVVEAQPDQSALTERYVARIADNRGMTPADIRNYTDNYPTLLQAAGGDMAQLALQQGLRESELDWNEEWFLAPLVEH